MFIADSNIVKFNKVYKKVINQFEAIFVAFNSFLSRGNVFYFSFVFFQQCSLCQI